MSEELKDGQKRKKVGSVDVAYGGALSKGTVERRHEKESKYLLDTDVPAVEDCWKPGLRAQHSRVEWLF